MINVIGQAAEGDVRPGRTYHKVGQRGEVSLLRIAHLIHAQAMRHATRLAAASYVRQRGHHLLVRAARLRLGHRGASVGKETKPFTGQTGTELVYGRQDNSVHGERDKRVEREECLIGRNIVQHYLLRFLLPVGRILSLVPDLTAQLILVEAVQDGEVHSVMGDLVGQLLRWCPTDVDAGLAHIFNRNLDGRTGYQLYTLEDALQPR